MDSQFVGNLLLEKGVFKMIERLIEIFDMMPEAVKPKQISYNAKTKRWIMAGLFVPVELVESVIVDRCHRWLAGNGCTVTLEGRCKTGCEVRYEWISDGHIVRAESSLYRATQVQRWVDQRPRTLEQIRARLNGNESQC